MPEEPTNEQIQGAVYEALGLMGKFDPHLFRVGVGERCLTFRLGFYLQKAFPCWNVDCEYNRDGTEPKLLEDIRDEIKRLKPKKKKSKGHVCPDIILHRRGTKGPNLLVIEAKKASELKPCDEYLDRLKLAAYQKRLGYRMPAFITFGVDENDDPKCIVDFTAYSVEAVGDRWKPACTQQKALKTVKRLVA